MNEPVSRAEKLSMFAAIILLLVLWGFVAHVTPANANYKRPPVSIANAGMQHSPPPRHTLKRNAWVVCQVWGRYRCVKILSVVWCESTLNPLAANGNQLGLFQMSLDNRRRYGHSRRNVWVQARAALALWRDRHWTPWNCKGTP